PAFSPPLAAPLVADLQKRLGPTCAANHARHADAATEALMGLIEQDMTRYGKTNETYRFFLAFATDVIDRYGRFLGYVYEDLPKQLRPKPNFSYNERLLPGGFVTPYFIWPNIDPFRTHANLLDAVPAPGQPITNRRLDDSRQAVRDARAAHKG